MLTKKQVDDMITQMVDTLGPQFHDAITQYYIQLCKMTENPEAYIKKIYYRGGGDVIKPMKEERLPEDKHDIVDIEDKSPEIYALDAEAEELVLKICDGDVVKYNLVLGYVSQSDYARLKCISRERARQIKEQLAVKVRKLVGIQC